MGLSSSRLSRSTFRAEFISSRSTCFSSSSISLDRSAFSVTFLASFSCFSCS
jgi:hypothetical protein